MISSNVLHSFCSSWIRFSCLDFFLSSWDACFAVSARILSLMRSKQLFISRRHSSRSFLDCFRVFSCVYWVLLISFWNVVTHCWNSLIFRFRFCISVWRELSTSLFLSDNFSTRWCLELFALPWMLLQGAHIHWSQSMHLKPIAFLWQNSHFFKADMLESLGEETDVGDLLIPGRQRSNSSSCSFNACMNSSKRKSWTIWSTSLNDLQVGHWILERFLAIFLTQASHREWRQGNNFGLTYISKQTGTFFYDIRSSHRVWVLLIPY